MVINDYALAVVLLEYRVTLASSWRIVKHSPVMFLALVYPHVL